MLSTFIPQVLDVFLPLNESRSREHPFHAEFFLDDEKDFYTIRFIMYFSIVFVLGVIIAKGAYLSFTCNTSVECLLYWGTVSIHIYFSFI